MILDFALLADRATSQGEGKVDLAGAGIGHVTADSVPTTVPSLAFVVRLLLEDDDRGREFELAFRVGKGDASLVQAPPFTIPAEASARRPGPGQDRAALVLVFELGQFRFNEYGAYDITMLVDGNVFISKELDVIANEATHVGGGQSGTFE